MHSVNVYSLVYSNPIISSEPYKKELFFSKSRALLTACMFVIDVIKNDIKHHNQQRTNIVKCIEENKLQEAIELWNKEVGYTAIEITMN